MMTAPAISMPFHPYMTVCHWCFNGSWLGSPAFSLGKWCIARDLQEFWTWESFRNPRNCCGAWQENTMARTPSPPMADHHSVEQTIWCPQLLVQAQPTAVCKYAWLVASDYRQSDESTLYTLHHPTASNSLTGKPFWTVCISKKSLVCVIPGDCSISWKRTLSVPAPLCSRKPSTLDLELLWHPARNQELVWIYKHAQREQLLLECEWWNRYIHILKSPGLAGRLGRGGEILLRETGCLSRWIFPTQPQLGELAWRQGKWQGRGARRMLRSCLGVKLLASKGGGRPRIEPASRGIG